MKAIVKSISLFVIISLVVVSCGRRSEKPSVSSNDLVIFHAGSLSLPMKAAVDSFTKLHPDVKFFLEAAGSVECARKITELGKPCDILASADYKVIDKLLIPQYASWNIPFAGNEMSIVYNDKSRYSKEINSENWFEILSKKDVAFGRSDPNSDPCGYRTVMTMKLAEKYYLNKNITKILLSKDLKNIRPKEVDLLALLESNVVDYIFLYKSVAIQHGLNYLVLPQEINLSSVGMEDVYKTVNVQVKGNTPESSLTMVGEPMVYGLTIPRNAPNPNLAIEFVKYFLDQNGGQLIIKNMGQTPIVPSVTSSYDSIPDLLKPYAIKK